MSAIEALELELRARPRTWLITGVAGFIGSHLAEHLLVLGQRVVGIDDFDTGTPDNLEALLVAAEARGASEARARFGFHERDVRELAACLASCEGVDHVLHEAAIASVPRTIAEPELAQAVNVGGTFNVLEAARRSGVRSVVLASSSAVYGDRPGEGPEGLQVEALIGRPLSPYAAHKRIGEIQAQAWTRSFGLATACLRYFNIVGARQDPEGAYAAVIPKWVAALAAGERPQIFGDGQTTRDFVPVEEVVQANLLAATLHERVPAERRELPGDPSDGAYNVGLGGRTTLAELFAMLRDGMAELGAPCAGIEPIYADFRAGDIRHSRADVGRAREILGQHPRTPLPEALVRTMRWLRG
ncbi:NAD-dependent epimerase/dehydratase family protein [Nannocystaceae bacterium ST9]